MCLYVDTNKHLANNSFVPKIADTDILVYKLLLLCPNGKFITPNQGYSISFENGKFVYPKTEIGKINCEFFTIDEGIHTYRYREYGEFHVCGYYKLFKAIIPKGSEYYIGACSDVVSNNLTVFENEIVYNKYESTHKVTIIE